MLENTNKILKNLLLFNYIRLNVYKLNQNKSSISIAYYISLARYEFLSKCTLALSTIFYPNQDIKRNRHRIYT